MDQISVDKDIGSSHSEQKKLQRVFQYDSARDEYLFSLEFTFPLKIVNRFIKKDL